MGRPKKVVSGWHVTGANRQGQPVLRYDLSDTVVEVGQTYQVEGRIRVCQNGLHVAPALRLAVIVGPPHVRFVTWAEVWEDLDYHPDMEKVAGRNRKVLGILSREQVQDALYAYLKQAIRRHAEYAALPLPVREWAEDKKGAAVPLEIANALFNNSRTGPLTPLRNLWRAVAFTVWHIKQPDLNGTLHDTAYILILLGEEDSIAGGLRKAEQIIKQAMNLEEGK